MDDSTNNNSETNFVNRFGRRRLISAVFTLMVLAIASFFVLKSGKFQAVSPFNFDLVQKEKIAQAKKNKEIADLAQVMGMQILQDGEVAIKESNLGKSQDGQKTVNSITLPDGTTYSAESDQYNSIEAIEGQKGGSLIDLNSNNSKVTVRDLKTQNYGKIDPNIKDKLAQNKKLTAIVVFEGLEPFYDLKDNGPKRQEKKTKFKEKHDKVSKLLASHGKILDDLFIINGATVIIDSSGLGLLEQSPDIQKVSEDRPVQAYLDTSLDEIHAKEIWSVVDNNNNFLTGAGMLIAILDTGVDYNHPDLGGCFGANCKVIGGFDYVNRDADPMDDNGHGTHVAATAGGKGFLNGVAPDAEILAYKVLNSSGTGTSTEIILAINAATDPNGDGDPSDHVDVGSMSLGGAGDPDDEKSRAVDNSTMAGVVWTIAAGNDGPFLSSVGSPGTARSAITVAAACESSQIGDPNIIDSRGRVICNEPIAIFSSRGPVVWQGEDVLKPDIAAPGVYICAARWGSSFSGRECLDDQHAKISGTSMATPHLAGAAALVRQAYPDMTPPQVKERLKNTARNLGMAYNEQGAGLVDLASAIPMSSAFMVGPTRTWNIFTNPTGTVSTHNQTFTIAARDSAPHTLNISSPLNLPGISLSFDNAILNIPNGQSASIEATLSVDNNVASNGINNSSIVLTEAGQPAAIIFIFLDLKPNLAISTAAIEDYGVDDPTASTWSSDVKQVTVVNQRTDVPLTVNITAANYSDGVIIDINPNILNIPAGGTGVFETKLTVDNSRLDNGLYTNGMFKVTALQSVLSTRTKFQKYFSLEIQDPDNMQSNFLTDVIIEKNGSLMYWVQLKQDNTLFYFNDAGNYNIRVSHWVESSTNKSSNRYKVFKEDFPIGTNGGRTVLELSSQDANHLVEIKGVDENGAPAPRLDHLLFSEEYLTPPGSWLVGSASGWDFAKTYYSDVNNFRIESIYGQSSPRQKYYYFGADFTGLNSDKILSFNDNDFKRTTIKHDLNMDNLIPISPAVGISMEKYGFGASDVRSGSLTTPLEQTIYSNAPSDFSFSVSSNSTRSDCLPTGACSSIMQTANFNPIDGRRWFYYYPQQMLKPFQEDTLYNGLGPSVWSAKFVNSPNNVKLNFFNHPSSWTSGPAFIRQDYSKQEYDETSYELYKDGVLAKNGNLPFYSLGSPQAILSQPLSSAGVYEFNINSFSYKIKKQDMHSKVAARFDTSKADPNPPAISRLYYYAGNLRSEVYDESVPNRVEFELDPIAGSLSQVLAGYSTDGTNFTPLNVSNGANGFSSDIPTLTNVNTLTIKIDASDSSNNSLSYSFEIPRKTVLDTVAPFTSITSPQQNAIITDNTFMAFQSSDNDTISKLELYMNNRLIAVKSAPPFDSYVWEASMLQSGQYTLETKAYDPSGNVGVSEPVTVNVQTDDAKPKAFLISPPDGDTLTGTIELSAQTSCTCTIKEVKFYRDSSILLGKDATAPYNLNLDTTTLPNGPHNIYVAVSTNYTLNYGRPRTFQIRNSPLQITKAVSATEAMSGDEITYSLQVKNISNETFTNSSIADLIPDGSDYIDGTASDGGTFNPTTRTLTWTIPVISPQETKIYVFKVKAR